MLSCMDTQFTQGDEFFVVFSGRCSAYVSTGILDSRQHSRPPAAPPKDGGASPSQHVQLREELLQRLATQRVRERATAAQEAYSAALAALQKSGVSPYGLFKRASSSRFTNLVGDVGGVKDIVSCKDSSDLSSLRELRNERAAANKALEELVEVPAQQEGSVLKVAEMRYRSCFGERAINFDEPRAATVVADTAVEVMVVGRVAYNRVVRAAVLHQFEPRLEVLSSLPVLASLGSEQLLRLASHLFEERYHPAATVLRAECGTDHFSIVWEGELQVRTLGKIGHVAKTIRLLGKGSSFGAVEASPASHLYQVELVAGA